MTDVVALIRIINGSDAKARATAHQSLLALKSEAISPLLATLDTAEAAIRATVVRLLPQFDDERIVPRLIQLTRDSEASVRSFATFGLGRYPGRPDVVAALVRVACEDPIGEVCRQAVQAMGRVGTPAQVVDVRLALLKSADADTVWQAVTGLGEFRDPRVAPALIELLRRPVSDAVLGMALHALAGTRDSNAFAAIAPFAGASQAYRRAVAAQALGKLRDPRSLALLGKLTNDTAVAWQEDRGPTMTVGNIARAELAQGH